MSINNLDVFLFSLGAVRRQVRRGLPAPAGALPGLARRDNQRQRLLGGDAAGARAQVPARALRSQQKLLRLAQRRLVQVARGRLGRGTLLIILFVCYFFPLFSTTREMTIVLITRNQVPYTCQIGD